MTAKEFALAQISPYYLDPSICGYDEIDHSCKHITPDGKMCVVGKNLIDPLHTINVSPVILLSTDQSILKPESRHYLTADQWAQLQELHDSIAHWGNPYNIHDDCDLFTLEELKQYCENLKTNQNG